MKKMLFMFFVIFGLLLSMQAMVFAVDISTFTTDHAGNKFVFSPANNVYIDYVAATAVPIQNFTITSKNVNGHRIFSTSNNTTSIWYQQQDGWKGTSLNGGTFSPAFTPISATDGYSSYASPWSGL